jgi:D-amino-acid dehydrogenase
MRLIVVGAGIVGAACAYAASGLGAEVVLVDAGLPGQATAAGAGIICPWTASADEGPWYDFACAAARHYPDLIAELADGGENDVSYRRVGALIVGRDAEETAREGQRMRTRQAATPEIGEVEVLTAAEAQALFPPLRPGSAAAYLGGAARVDGRRLTGALVRAARRRGAVTWPGRATLACRAGRVTGVEIDGQLTGADAVVAAAGAWTTSFLAPASVSVTVTPQRGQIVHISLEPADTSRWPVILPTASGHYLLAFDDSRVVAGATRETGAGFDVRVTAGGLHEVLARALEVAPGLAAGTHLETRVGLRPAAARPLLGPAAGVAGLVVATGLGATGLTMGPLAGVTAAQVALGIKPESDLAPFRPTGS